MFNDINLSNALALIDKPVWVITEVRGRNKNNRTYSKSRSKNVIYPATITNVQVWRGYSHSKGDTGCPKCTVTVDIATKDDTGTEIYFDLPNELLNVTVFESKEDAEKELAYLNSNKNTMTYSEQRQREDIRRYDIKPAVIRTEEEMHEFYRTQPDEMILAALVEVDDKVTGKRYCSIRVWCSGHEVKTRSTGSYYVLNKHYLTVNKDDMVATYPYPFSCDDGANTLLKATDTNILTPVERLFLWTEYKNPNPIETKKK